MLGRGQKSFERISVCVISTRKHFMYAKLHDNYSPEMCFVFVQFEVKHDHYICVRHSAGIAQLLLSHICLSVSVL